MIQRLAIRHYAIIDHLEVEFPDGFIVFTGETGAGKSIILGALGLLTGERADTSVIRSGCERAIVEGEFSLKDPTLKEILKNLDIDASESLIVRREIVSDGRGRVFINGLQEPLSPNLRQSGNILWISMVSTIINSSSSKKSISTCWIDTETSLASENRFALSIRSS